MAGTGIIDQFLETFTRYIDSGFGLLGGEVGYLATTLAAIDKGGFGEAFSKWFGRYKRDLGIDNPSSVFHSFRHGFKDALRAAGVNEDLNDALTGHSGGNSVARGYGWKDMVRRFGFPTLAGAVDKVEYPGLNLAELRWTRSRLGSGEAP